jgi:hypothetical protein
MLVFTTGLLQGSPVFAQDKKSNTATKEQEYKFDHGKQTLNKGYVDKILNKKMKLMQGYLSVLIEKKKSNYKSYIDSAMLLFNNDASRLITITSSTTGKVYVKPVREYLADVAKLPYKSINITYRNFTAIENIRRQPDGSYRGVAVLDQEFTGFDKEGNALYNDIVRRDIEVMINIREYTRKESHLVAMDIFFGNMGVTEFTSAR